MPPKLGSVTVTIDATPRIDTEALSRAMHDVLRRNGIGEYATVEEALRHRAVGCDTCGTALAYRCIHGKWCGDHRCDMSTDADRCGTTKGVGDGVTKAAADEQRDSILPAADDLPRAADDSEGSDGG